jgi:YkoP domain
MLLPSLGRQGVRLIERMLARYYGVFEFTPDPRAILRLSRNRSLRAVTLSDGTQVQKGDALLVLHFRNEQLAALLRSDASLESGLVFVRGARHSFKLLAEFLSRQREFDDIRALYAEFGFIQDARMEQMARLSTRLGFDFVPRAEPGWDVRQRAFWDNVFSWWLMWTFNPASLAAKSFTHMRRCEVWMARARLMERYRIIHEGHE